MISSHRLATLIVALLTVFAHPALLAQDVDFNRAPAAAKRGQPADHLDSRTLVVFQDSAGHHWFAGGDSGVFRLEGDRLTRYSTTDGLASHSVLGIQEDGHGMLYFDTLKGVSTFDGTDFKTLKVVSDEDSKEAWKMEEGDLWFRAGWDKNGPLRFDGESLYQLEFPAHPRAAEFRRKFPNATWSPYGIYSMYQDRSGAIWFGTAALGACRFDGQSIRWLYEDQLTHTPAGGAFGIRSIIEDRKGYFWFCNSRYRFQLLPEHELSNDIKYQTKPGVGIRKANGELSYPYFMSVVEDDKGELWMATYDNGVWQKSGEELVHHPLKKEGEPVLSFSIYKDRQGVLWLGTHNDGVYRFNGTAFERWSIDR